MQGIEDALGCMDFKVAGTRQGITSLQVQQLAPRWLAPHRVLPHYRYSMALYARSLLINLGRCHKHLYACTCRYTKVQDRIPTVVSYTVKNELL